MMWRGLRVYSGICPDSECRAKLYFPSYASSSVECTGCGQHHAKDSLLNVEDIQDPDIALRSLLRSVLLGHASSKTTPDLVKVKGYSNYHCKLLSPFLTHYGMDKKTGEGKLLREMGQGSMFDCAVLGDRAFQIESEHVETAGYGRDKTGSHLYLEKTLQEIKIVNDNEERLIPVHVDGDGHCLVHAISRALVGREIFWHALRVNLKSHLETELHKYKGLFRDFIHDDEWKDIISEADPYFQPPESSEEGLGLRNIHLFGLANVLHRPIILLDSMTGMQSSGDYSGIFLPALIAEDKCKSKDDTLNKPLAVAWSSPGRNHFIPLVGVKGKPIPKLPNWLIPKAWGIPNELVKRYVEFDNHGHCFIGGERCLQEKYLQRLVKAMDDIFIKKNNIDAQLVTEVHQFVYKPSGMVGVKPETVTMAAKSAVADGRLYRCLSCNALSEIHFDISSELLRPGGELYNMAVDTYGPLEGGVHYPFLRQELICVLDAELNMLLPIEHKNVALRECHFCRGPLRRVKSDGSAVYMNGDRTTTPVEGQSHCRCGFKHYWNGREYDNMPESFPISLEWGGETVSETVYWFQYEHDPSLNSNVYDVATKLVQKHFPGEFGSERLVQKVVDIILRQTAKREGENKGARPNFVSQNASGANSDKDTNVVSTFTPTKIILTGEKKKTLHKEELTMSETERVLKTRTEHHAAIMQKRRSGEGAKKTADKEAKVPKQQTGVKLQQASAQSSPSKTGEAQPVVKRNDKKVRLSTSDGKQSMLTLAMNTTFRELQNLIEKELGIPPQELRIRYGFPPRELHPPDDGHEEDPVPLQHGDRVMVEHLKPVVPEQIPPDVVMSEVEAQGGENTASSEAEAKSDQQRQAENNAAMASALFNALGALTGGDMWEAAENCPEMFDRGGYYYERVVNDLGPLQPNQHCTLPVLPNKVFAYNAQKDRLDLCLGQRHIQVQPLDKETLLLAHTRQAQIPSEERTSSSLSSEASFSGAIGNRHTSHARMAFSGKGQTLSGAQSPPKPPVESLAPRILLANPSTSQTNTDQSEANRRQEEVKQVQDQNSKDLKPETSQPSESMITEKLDVDKEQHVREMLVENPREEQNLKDLKEVTSASSEPMVTGQVDVKKEEHVPETLVENPSAQSFKDLKEETSASSESMITEQVDVKKEQHVPEMLVENSSAQNFKDVKEERSASFEPMITEQVDVKKEELAPDVLVENPSTQNFKDLKEETSTSSDSMVTGHVDVEKEEHAPEMLFENSNAQNFKDLKEDTSTSSESMITAQLDVDKLEHVPEMLSENSSTQNFKDLKEETSASSESMITEQFDVEKEENVEKMLVENPGATEDVVQVSPTHGEAEQITQLERDTGEPEVACVPIEENELMETNQGNIENVVDELVAAVNDSTKLSEQGGNVECIETTSESMETDQVTSKEDGVTHKARQFTTDESHNQASSGDLTGGEVVDNAVDSEIHVSDSTVNRAGAASSDAVMLQVSVAMEIDTLGESSDANSPTEVELSESKYPSKHLQEPEIALDREPNQALDSGDGETSAVMNVETLAECNTNESSVQDDTSSKDSELYTTPATNT